MVKLIILLVVVAGIAYILQSVFDRPLTQWLKNKDNRDQREHDRSMEEMKHNNWKEKKEIESRLSSDDIPRLE